MRLKTKSIVYGIAAVLIVIGINLLVLSLLGFPKMALNIIFNYLPLIVFLIFGFGVQVGLFVYFNGLNAISCSTTVASGGISGVSMILCCSHYLLNLLPFLGAFIGASFLTSLSNYVPYFLWIGIFSNVLGIGIMFHQNRKYGGSI